MLAVLKVVEVVKTGKSKLEQLNKFDSFVLTVWFENHWLGRISLTGKSEVGYFFVQFKSRKGDLLHISLNFYEF
jgi:hypothetical protein